jgi:hypothetical protein
MKKMWLWIGAALLLFVLVFAAWGRSSVDRLPVLVLHKAGAEGYLDVYQHYKQGLVVGVEVDDRTLDNWKKVNLDRYRLVYLDRSLLDDAQFSQHVGDLVAYVERGGNLFVENEFHDRFPKEFLGAKEFRALAKLPDQLEFPQVRPNLQGLQGIVQDFYGDYQKFDDAKTRQPLPGGVGMVASTATPLVTWQGTALYAMNTAGKGHVFFAHTLLPNHSYVTGFDMVAKSGEPNAYFNFTAASGTYLLRNEMAAFVGKETYGYALKKVLGPYGRPAMAYQNHFEVTTAVREGAMEKWIDMAAQYHQIPSYSLARAVYDWANWNETVAFHLNQGTNERPQFVGEEANSLYSSGRHTLVGTNYLALQAYPTQKYLKEPIDLPYRAYPFVVDMNGDGKMDVLAGSADGHLYSFISQGLHYTWQFEPGRQLTLADGSPLTVGTYSAPILYDLDGDRLQDLVVGNGAGEVLWYRNLGNWRWGNSAVLVAKSAGMTTVAPDIGDVDGDGVDDLVLGDEQGRVSFCKGVRAGTGLRFTGKRPLSTEKGPLDIGRFAAPKLYDWNGDGKKDLLLGTDEGYVRVFRNQYPRFADGGFVDGQTSNPFGQKHLWGGHNVVPCLADINGDGRVDLVMGQLEHARALPIDSPLFPYEKELRKGLAAAKARYIDIQPHVFVHNYKSAEQEKQEIELHQKAFAYYGLPWERVGTNQHTWRVNNVDPTQTFRSEMRSGVWWNSGFQPANQPIVPSRGLENAWNVPFYLADGRKTAGMMLFNPVPTVPDHEDAYPSLTRLDLPVTYFVHVEYLVLSDPGRKALAEMAGFLDGFRNKYDYNFMTEEQMFRSFHAALQSDVRVEKSWWRMVREKWFGGAAGDSSLVSSSVSEIHVTAKAPERSARDGAWNGTVGVKLELGESLVGKKATTDSEIFMRQGDELYVGVGHAATIRLGADAAGASVVAASDAKADAPHIVRVNGPVDVHKSGDAWRILLQGQGLQQIKLHAPHGVKVKSTGWEVQQDGDEAVLTRYGGRTVLEVEMAGS